MQLHEKYNSEGLTVIGVTREGGGKVEPYIEANGVTYPIGQHGSMSSEWGVSGIPHAFLVDGSGTVVWRGHPSGINDALIEKHLSSVVLFELPDNLPDELSKAAKYFEARAYGKALKEAQRELDDEDVGAVAQEVVDVITGAYEQFAATAEKQIESRDIVGAIGSLQRIEQYFAGSDFADKAEDRLKEMSKNDDLKRHYDAAVYYMRIREKEKGADSNKAIEKVIQLYESVAADYGDTEAGKAARKRADMLKKDR